jgi:hypothetical protein
MAVRFADARSQVGSRLHGDVGTGGLAVAAAAALATAFAASPSRVANGPVLCPFRLATGLPCPGCGLTRSWVYIAHGDFGAALRANPFGYVTMAAAIAVVAVALASLGRGRPIPSMSPVVRSRPFLAVLGLWVVFAGVRVVAVATG